jgi:hypothetical protein
MANGTPPAPAPRRAPLPAKLPTSTGYYNYTFAIIFLLFLIFIISRGELQAWINILFSAPTPPPQVGQSPTVATSPSSAATNPKVNAVPGQPGQSPFPNYATAPATNPSTGPAVAAPNPPMGAPQARNPVTSFIEKFFGINPAY